MSVPARSPSPDESVRQQILAAIRGELEAVRARQCRRPVWHAIGRGRCGSLDASGAVYVFGPSQHVSVRRDQVVELSVGAYTTCARVLAVTEGELVLACFERLGDTTPPAKIRWDASWLLEELHAAVTELDLEAPSARLLLDPPTTGISRTGQPAPAWCAGALDGLNPEQARAVRRGFGSDISYVWGPPGCGKTTTLAALVRTLVQAGRTVLAVAPTNRAVDGLMLAVAERLSAARGLEPGELLRVGPIVSPDLERRFSAKVDPGRVAEADVDAALRGFALSDDHLEAVEDVLDRLAGARSDLDGPAAGGRVDVELRSILLEDRHLLRHRAQLRRLLVVRKRCDLLAEARVVATTLHRAFLPGQFDRRFDTVIVDEASAASFPLVLAAAARAHRIVIAGDFRQLPPVVVSERDEVKAWMGSSAFEVGGVPDRLAAGERPAHLHVLRQQYRMGPDIAGLVGRVFYEDRLQTPASVAARAPSPALPFHGKPLVHVDSSCVGPSLRSDRTNRWHLFAIRQLLGQVRSFVRREGIPAPKVAVLCPYRAELSYLRDALGHEFDAHFGTVHTTQGREYDVVILDLPETGAIRPTGFIRATELNDVGARLLNVAISRARQQVIVVADGTYFRTKTPARGIFRRVLDELDRVAITKVVPKER